MMRHSVQKLLKQRDDMLLLSGSVLLLSSVFFFFGPLQLYIINITELWFSFWDVFWPSLITFFIVSCILMGLGVLLYRWKKLFYGYDALLCGLGIALYIQGNFLPFPYGILNGNTIHWDSYRHEAVISGLVWVLCLAIPLVLIFAFQAKGKQVLKYSSLGITLVQLVALAVLGVTTDFSKSAESNIFLSDEGLLEVSEKQNVVIFLLDAFDESFLDEIRNEAPGFLEFLEGFTCFTDATSSYPNTRGSLPYLLTGQRFMNEKPHNEYLAEAWENSYDYYNTLAEMGFEIGIYINPSVPVIPDIVKQLFLENAIEESLKVSDSVDFEGAILQFTAMRFFPDTAKEYVWAYSNLFEQYMTANKEDAIPYTWDETKFYEQLLNQKLSLTDKKKYHFIHLDGTHTPYTVLEDLTEDASEATAITEAKGSLNVIREYIRQMKELNVYDQTCMIILADHGKISPYPILIAKPFYGDSDLKYEDRPVSHADLLGTILEQLEIEDYQRSLFKLNVDIVPERICFRYLMDGELEWNKSFFPDMYEFYAIQDDKVKMLVPTGRIYTQYGIKTFTPNECTIGEPIILNGNKNIYSTSYFSFFEYSAASDEEYLWALGHYGRGLFHVGDLEADLMCHIAIHNWVPKDVQHVIIKSKDVTLYDGTVVTGMTHINFLVPKFCLNDGYIALDFEFPGAESPQNLGINSEDNRILSIAFKEIMFEEAHITSEILFMEEGNATNFVYDGWNGIGENGACWTNETAKLIAILPNGNSHEMEITYTTNPAAGDTHVYYNDEHIGILPHHDNHSTEKIILPSRLEANSNAQIITFVTDNATTYGGRIYEDTLILGIHVSEIHFTDVQT